MNECNVLIEIFKLNTMNICYVTDNNGKLTNGMSKSSRVIDSGVSIEGKIKI